MLLFSPCLIKRGRCSALALSLCVFFCVSHSSLPSLSRRIKRAICVFSASSSLRVLPESVFGFSPQLVLLSFISSMISADLGFSESTESWSLGLALSTSGVGGLLSGILADRVGRKTMLSATILTYSAGSLVCFFFSLSLSVRFWCFLR